MKRFFALIGLAGALALPACGGGLGSALGIPSIPPSPTPSPVPVLSVTPATATLSLSNAGGKTATATITASENTSFPSYSAATTDATVATVALALGSQNAFVITAVKVGAAKIHVSDQNGTGFDVPVTVNP